MVFGTIYRFTQLDHTPTLMFVQRMRELENSEIITLTLVVDMASEFSTIWFLESILASQLFMIQLIPRIHTIRTHPSQQTLTDSLVGRMEEMVLSHHLLAMSDLTTSKLLTIDWPVLKLVYAIITAIILPESTMR
jgi:hypothetical protein